MTVCFCTLAFHAPYRRRARLLCADAPQIPWIVLTDAPEDFADLPVRAIGHAPTGPLAVDFLERIGPTGNNRGGPAYHDKRFVLQHALRAYDTAIFLDADSRITGLSPLGDFPPGLSVLPLVRKSVAEHLDTVGSWRLPAFVALAEHLAGSADILHQARWCHEACIAVTRDGHEEEFFELWGRAAEFLQARSVFSGEGGALGLAAAGAGWMVDFDAVVDLGSAVQHEGGGPKSE